tara:strand:+ start:995 stop:2056 length:1062 start_codon:yes stop_codon:yes gene_type:complete
MIKLPNGTTVELDGQFDFKAKYANWVTECEGISSAKMLSEGKAGNPKPANLYLQLEQHVTDAWVRNNSSNKGKNQGAFRLLADIDKSMKQRELYDTKDIKEIKSFIRKINRYNRADSSVNPSNIIFHRPTSFTGKGEEIEITEDEPIEIYGHYADDYFAAKYEKKQAPSSWYDRQKNTSNPPLKQALFGKGDLIKVGLLDILEEAEVQLENMKITHLNFQPARISNLAGIPSLRKRVLEILRNKDLFNKGTPKYKAIIRFLESQRFVVGSKSKAVANSAELSLPYGIETFSFQKLTSSTVGTLLAAVVGKTPKKIDGYYLNIRGKTVVPKTPEVKAKKPKGFKKSWIEQLWRD